jgi:hypothetical protein
VKVKTSELADAGLAWAIAIIEGWEPFVQYFNVMKDGKVVGKSYYMTCHKRQVTVPINWSEAGPIIERERLSLFPHTDATGTWCCVKYAANSTNVLARAFGPTPLIAAMRCFVASKLGDEVDVPEELFS